MEKRYYVYIVTNFTRSVLYTGISNDLVRRTFEHKEGRGSYFTSKYKTNKLVYFEEYSDPLTAIAREKQIKAGSRIKKIALIESLNPEWKDLSAIYSLRT